AARCRGQPGGEGSPRRAPVRRGADARHRLRTSRGARATRAAGPHLLRADPAPGSRHRAATDRHGRRRPRRRSRGRPRPQRLARGSRGPSERLTPALAVLTWICLPRLEAGLFRALLVISSASIVVSMLLAVVYAWSELTQRAVLDIASPAWSGFTVP